MDRSPRHREADRLEALARLRLMDSAPEPEFDELVQLAASLCGMPISTITLVDDRRQWFKAVTGLESHGGDREVAFCSHTIQQCEMFVVEDARGDRRFAENPLVTGEPHIRFYAGVPLTSPEGEAVGSLCVMDRLPRHLNEAQSTALAVLARQVSARMELRMRRLEQQEMLDAQQKLNRELQAAQDRFRAFMDQSPFLSFVKNVDGRLLYYNRRFAERFGISMSAWLGKNDFDLFPADDARAYRENDLAVLRGGRLQVLEERSRESDGSPSVWQVYKFPCASGEGLTMLGGIAVDVTESVVHDERLARMRAELAALREQVEMMSSTAVRERTEALAPHKLELALAEI